MILNKKPIPLVSPFQDNRGKWHVREYQEKWYHDEAGRLRSPYIRFNEM